MSGFKDEIKAACLSLLLNKPFFGFIVQKMDFIESKQSPYGSMIGTAATDGKNIIYNEDFFKSLSNKERIFVIGHEILHCVTATIPRLGDRDRMYWNMASDYVINDILKNEGVGSMPSMGLYDAKYHGWIAEEVYEDLVKNNAKKQQPLDVHLKLKGYDDQEDEGKNGGSGDEDTLEIPREEFEKNLKEFKNTIIEAVQRSKMAGHGVGNLDRILGEFLEPKINWRALLASTIQSLFKTDITWTRPNRRSLSPNMILPSMQWDETVDICVSMDTSGSISDEQCHEFLSEIAGLLQYYRTFKLKLWCFDTQVHAFESYEQHNINELVNYKPGGGGGTSVGCNYSWMEENDIKPKAFICLTDGYTGSDWGDVTYCPTTFIIHSNPNPQVPDGCRWALFEDLVGR